MSIQTILIVMPVYNSEKTLRNAIESILSQTYKNFRLIVVDDFSTDSSLEIAKSYLYDKRVFVYKTQKNMGAYYCRNLGLYVSKNLDWGMFTTHDSDDVSYPSRLEVLAKIMNKNVFNSAYDIFIRKDLYSKKEISRSLTIAHMIFKKSVFDEIGYFEQVRYGADWEYWKRLSANNRYVGKKTIAWQKALGDSYIHENNLTVQIPLGSEPRRKYMEETLNKLSRIKRRSDLYVDFNPLDYFVQIFDSPEKPKILKKKVTVLLLTWKRIQNLEKTLTALSNQTYKNFDIQISNANIPKSAYIDQVAARFNHLDINVSHDGNDIFAFRRFSVGKKLFAAGTEIVLYIDDDITFPETYIETCLSQYEPKTYKSGFTWVFSHGGENYYKFRQRVYDNHHEIHYAGTGISMIDASIFEDKDLIDSAPKELYTVEDLWLSYFVKKKPGWEVKYMETPGIVIGGNDSVALFKQVLKEEIDKAAMLKMLVNMGWSLPQNPLPKPV